MSTQERIDAQRRKLQQAHAILSVASFAASHDVEADYGDVMAVVAEMVEAAVHALDSVELARSGDTGRQQQR